MAKSSYYSELRDQIAQSFNMEELKLLVFDLNLDWDELHGWGKTARVQDLIVRLGQKGQLDELIALLHTQRSHIAWSDPPPKGRQRADVGDSFSAFDTLKILLSGSPNASVTYSRINTEGGDVVNRDKYVIDTAHIDILQPPQPFYQRRAFWGVIFAFLAVTTLLVATGLGKEIANALAPLPFAREAEGETLIVIATFDRTEGVTDTNIHGELHQAIVDELEGLGVGNVRVEIEPTVLKAGDKERAESLGQQYNASIIIWGADTGVRLTVDFLNLKEPDFDAARVTLHETMRTQLANPEAYAQFVVRDLPNQISFLSLFAVGQSFYVQQNYTQAIPILERGVDLVPLGSVLGEDFELENAYFLLGWLYGTTEQYKQAIANYDRTLELNPQAAAAFNNRGGAYYYLGEYEQAFADYGRALELNPQFAEAFGNRGVAYADLGGYEQAFADYGRALEINPQFAEAFNNRGNAYSDLGEYKQALADYGRALELNPQYAEAFNNRGNAYSDLGEYKQALADYGRALELNPQYTEAFNNRGNAYADLGEYEQAFADYDRALEINPQDAGAFNNRGVAYADLGEYEQAIADFGHALEINPQDAGIYYNRGNAYANLGEYEQAFADYGRALEINRQYAAAFLNRGATHGLLEQYPEAIADWRRYLELEPQSPQRQAIEYAIVQMEAELDN